MFDNMPDILMDLNSCLHTEKQRSFMIKDTRHIPQPGIKAVLSCRGHSPCSGSELRDNKDDKFEKE